MFTPSTRSRKMNKIAKDFDTYGYLYHDSGQFWVLSVIENNVKYYPTQGTL